MKHLVFVVDEVEDTELIATVDVLKRGGEIVDLVSVTNNHEVISKLGIKMYIDKLIKDIDYSIYDSLIIPGGPGSYKYMKDIPIIYDIIKYFYDNNKLISAICASPMHLGILGLLDNIEFTCYPSFEEYMPKGIYLKDEGVVRSGNIITAKSMYYSIEFGLKIFEYFYGEEKRIVLEKSLMK